MVWHPQQLTSFIRFYDDSSYKLVTAGQVELWRRFDWRVPYRPGRAASFILDLTQPRLGNHETADIQVHNLGFCVSDRNMFWKHMVGLGISGPLKDSIPNEAWFEQKWLGWHPKTNNQDMEISLGAERNIPYAVPYPQEELPHYLLDGMSLEKWPWLKERVG